MAATQLVTEILRIICLDAKGKFPFDGALNKRFIDR